MEPLARADLPDVWWVFLEDPLDVRAKRCEFFPGEDSLEQYPSV